MSENIKESFWKKNKYLLIGIPIILIICVTGVWGWILFRKHLEEVDYNKLSDSTDIKQYERFLDDYPNSVYYNEVHEQYIDMKESLDDWKAVSATNNAAELESFIASHPQSAFEKQAKERIDSLLWTQALRYNSIEFYNDYLMRVPEGKYIAEAQTKLKKLELYLLNPDEENQVRSIVNGFVNTLAHRDREGALAYFGNQISFMGKNVNRGQMMKWIEGFFGDDVYSIRCDVTEINVNKNVGENDVVTYTSTFNCDLFFGRYDAEKPRYQQRSGRATLSSDFKVKTFVWNVVSSQN